MLTKKKGLSRTFVVNQYKYIDLPDYLFSPSRSDILGAVQYINGLYGTATGITSDESSSHHTETVRGSLFPLCPLRIGTGQIVYKMMSKGEYHVLLLVDFLAELPVHLRRKTSRGSRKGKYVLCCFLVIF